MICPSHRANEWQSWDLSPNLSDPKDISVWAKSGTEHDNLLRTFLKIQVWGPWPCFPKSEAPSAAPGGL